MKNEEKPEKVNGIWYPSEKIIKKVFEGYDDVGKVRITHHSEPDHFINLQTGEKTYLENQPKNINWREIDGVIQECEENYDDHKLLSICACFQERIEYMLKQIPRLSFKKKQKN